MRTGWLSRIGALALVAVALVGVGCTSDRPATGGVDVARAFVGQITAADFSRHVEISGTLSVGTIAGSFEGEMDLAGGDSRFEMDGDVGGSRSRHESITIDGVTYQRDDGGPWIQKMDADSEEMSGWLTALSTVELVGVERIDGEELHHLRPSQQPSPEAMGFADADIRYTDVSVDFFADDRGTPKMMTVFLTGVVTQDAPLAEMDLRFRFAGPAQAIAAPDDVWSSFTSASGDTIAHPQGWAEMSDEGVDVLRAPGGGPEVYLAANDIPRGVVEEDAPEAFVRSVERRFGTRSSSVEFYEVDGTTGLLAELRPHGESGTLHVMYFVAPRGGRVHEVVWIGRLGVPDEDRATFEGMLGTYGWSR